MFGVRIGKAVSSFSLALFLLALCAASVDFRQLSAEYAEAQTFERRRQIAREILTKDAIDQPLRSLAQEVADGRTERGAELKEALAVRGELIPPPAPVDLAAASSQARAIKQNPLFSDAGAEDQANWIQRAFERLRNLRFRQPGTPEINTPTLPTVTNLDRWLIGIMWGLLALLVLGLLWFAFRHFHWKRTLRRKAMALLEEDEPERTVDQWLVEADRLTADGRYREAVRCLYIACLLRFDEQGVARFDRGETNWEHLRRIQASPTRPADLDFVEPTRHFDTVWYGGKVRGVEDIDRMRSVYEAVTRSEARAA